MLEKPQHTHKSTARFVGQIVPEKYFIEMLTNDVNSLAGLPVL